MRITGVGFFDRQHNQTGRALNGIELHPVLDIVFNPSSPTPTPTPAPGPSPPTSPPILQNPGFENGAQGWTATADVITNRTDQPAHSGTFKAWLGGYGEIHTDRLSQQVSLPANANTVTLSFFLHIATEEQNTQAFDRLRVRIRAASGQILQTLKTFSNLQAAHGFSLQSFDVTAFRGQTVRIELEVQEDNGLRTSFVVDDFAIVVE